MGRHSKPLTQSQKFWINVQYYGAMGFFAVTLGITFAAVLD